LKYLTTVLREFIEVLWVSKALMIGPRANQQLSTISLLQQIGTNNFEFSINQVVSELFCHA
jgi:hypothetical protein